MRPAARVRQRVDMPIDATTNELTLSFEQAVVCFGRLFFGLAISDAVNDIVCRSLVVF